MDDRDQTESVITIDRNSHLDTRLAALYSENGRPSIPPEELLRAAQQILGDLLAAEIAEKQARSIRYQVSAARLPLAKELSDFDFAGSPINEDLVRELAVGTFLSQQRNTVLVGGTGTSKSHYSATIWMGRVLPHPRMLPNQALPHQNAPVAASLCQSAFDSVRRVMREIRPMLAALMSLRAQFESRPEDFRSRFVIAGVAATAEIVAVQTAQISVA